MTSSGFCDCDGGEDAFVVPAGFEALFSSYFWRFLILEAVGLRTEYLDVIRV
jgi:hypothetical protein